LVCAAAEADRVRNAVTIIIAGKRRDGTVVCDKGILLREMQFSVCGIEI
jgi:hypothetical protein